MRSPLKAATAALALIAAFTGVPVPAQEAYPAHPVTVVVPFPRIVGPCRSDGFVLIAVTALLGVAASATVTLPAGTTIGPEHCPTATVSLSLNPLRVLIENVKLPVVKMSPAILQTSTKPVCDGGAGSLS